MNSYDVVVVGVGGIGSATAYHLAKAGASVLGLDQYDIPNDLGSSHGITRIIRLAYYEDPSYVPLLKRAYELWHDLECQSGKELLITTGSIDAGQNTAVGYQTGVAITSGIQNTLIGASAGDSITTGRRNVAIGTNELIDEGYFIVVSRP